ncbi:putative P-type ATPase [Aspergillus homomorphus CBS 101889]|uniref:Cation-transporting ATPase n=1 Tax=Aspergillus homomorphus (strain CBS 101889) TaxID=1450537 RepID=A0A395HLU3_ASPHC|nr:putative P-type ATPase [Aspergillus homomorphus CBS 101889]RAL08393.1 putative P-type ATPase [Aspergillus homomorphus CBS 101889]
MEDRQVQAPYSEVYSPGAENRRNSMRSSYSIMSEVGMARNEVYDGPMSESVPSSIVSFSHRRDRKDSNTSFTYFQDNEEHAMWPHEDALDVDSDRDEISVDGFNTTDGSIRSSKPRPYSRGSVEDPLLQRSLSVGSYAQNWRGENRTSQKVHIMSEDLTIVIAGFSTSITGLVMYYMLCALSFGFAYLLFRWFPKWRVRLLGKSVPLDDCRWVAIEDQWNRFQIQSVDCQDYGRPLSTIWADPDCRLYDEDNDPTIAQLRCIDYRYLRFFYHPVEDRFCLVNGWKDPSWTNVKGMRLGLDADDRDNRELIFGKNLIDIQQKPVFQLLMDEAFHPFYIFQLASLVLWSLDEYYYYAVCIFLISVISIGATVIETRTTMSRLRELSLFECDTRVLRNGFWRSIPSRELVPGDVYEFSDPSLTQVPCDCILLSGDCIVNESMLTGESVPVTKVPLTDDALRYLDLNVPSIDPNLAKHFLFSGTKIIRARRPQNVDDDEAIALAVVVRTGFLTTKGALIRTMLFPKPSGFKFYRDSFRYISVMGLVAILGFIASFVNFVRLGLPWQFIIVRALDLITIVVPPALPATLSIGTNFALSRLKNHKIFCISPQRVNVGGKLDIICFDKTGTLTEDGLDVLGIRIVDNNASFSGLISTINFDTHIQAHSPALHDTSSYANILHTMATCHSLRVVDGELLGDPLDVKMFQFTGWSFDEGGSHIEQPDSETIMPSIAKPPERTGTIAGYQQDDEPHAPVELGILRNFEFISELRRASVVVRQFGDPGARTFVKGAPESVKAICLPESLPRDFDELLGYYTHKGYRVIACAAKYQPKLSWMKIQKMTRHDAECNLEFLGFIVFENKLKPKTTRTIAELNQAGIRNVMCTGDNILTAVSVARECGLVSSNEHCFVPHFLQGYAHDSNASLCWESVDDPAIRLDPTTLMPQASVTGIDLSVPGNISNLNNYSLAVSGEVFRWAVDFGSETILDRMLVRGSVFARMSPDEKHELVEKLQSLDYCCGFCGDGANDCGALKAADVGISLSDAEASVAAPFTSRQFDISCVPTLIREGRAALVTSFCCFKYMSLYSAIQFATVSLLYASASNLGDFQFLFIDLFLILPIAIFMGWTGPHPILSRKRPTADLVSRKVLIPLLGQITLCIITQLVAYKHVQLQPWFKPPNAGLENNIGNSANTVLFLISSFQYILSSVVLSAGPPFRKPMISNKPFLFMVLLNLLFSCYMLFRPSRWLRRVMQLTSIPNYFAWQLLLIVSGSFFISWMAERRFLPTFARQVGKLLERLRQDKSKKRRRYKMLLDEMRN